MTESKEVKIDGITYIPKEETELCENYFIIRTYSAGVFAGEVVTKDDKTITLKNARRIWKWVGAASLSQLAVDGVSKPNECLFPCEVDNIILNNWIEIINCTKKAQKSIKGVPIWKT